MASIHDLKLGADQLGEFYTIVSRFISKETFITDVIETPEKPETIEVMVYGSEGTNLHAVMDDCGWLVHEEFANVQA